MTHNWIITIQLEFLVNPFHVLQDHEVKPIYFVHSGQIWSSLVANENVVAVLMALRGLPLGCVTLL
jgi:hypothetical protein